MNGTSSGGCYATDQGAIQSWFDLQAMMPRNPLGAISYMKPGSTEGLLVWRIYWQAQSSNTLPLGRAGWGLEGIAQADLSPRRR